MSKTDLTSYNQKVLEGVLDHHRDFCLLCKSQACKGTGEHVKPSERRARQDEREQKAEATS